MRRPGRGEAALKAEAGVSSEVAPEVQVHGDTAGQRPLMLCACLPHSDVSSTGLSLPFHSVLILNTITHN